MPPSTWPRRGPKTAPTRWHVAALLVAVLVLPAAARPASAIVLAGESVAAPQLVTLPAPFECGTRWQGTTYHGHGADNWNLDLNRADLDRGEDRGQPILAQAEGTVVWFAQTGYNNRAGTYLEIDYGDVTVRYLHLVANSIPEPVAEVGATVEAGDLIGALGSTGRSTGPHLHLEYWDSAGHDDARAYQLRGRQLPVYFDGQKMIATPSTPSPEAVSTNCSTRWSAPSQILGPIGS